MKRSQPLSLSLSVSLSLCFRKPFAAHAASLTPGLCGLHGRFIFAFKICTLRHICQTVHIEIFARDGDGYTPTGRRCCQSAGISLSLHPRAPSHYHFSLVVSPKFHSRRNSLLRSMDRLVDHACVVSCRAQYSPPPHSTPSNVRHYDSDF